MMTEEHEKLYINWFKSQVETQNKLTSELIGDSICDVFYTDNLKEWDIDIIQNNVIHVPTGYISFVTKQNKYYRINTDYQSWSGSEFGLLLESQTKNEFKIKLQEKDIIKSNEKKWLEVLDSEITDVSLNWKYEREYNSFEGLSKNYNTIAARILTTDYFPDNLSVKFKNGKELFIVAAEPDYEVGNNRYYLNIAGEELMVFFDRNEMEKWGIKTLGFTIK